MAAVTICSDFEAQKIKSDTVSTKPLDYSKLADIEQEEKEAPRQTKRSSSQIH